MMSVYDYPTARFAEAAGIESLLVGDSLAMTVLGHTDTVSVTTEEMLHHVKAVSRGAERAMVVADMPFLSYQTSQRDAVWNAGRFLKEGRADAVKVECGRNAHPTVQAIHDAGIPVIAHIGLTPQSAGQLGGLKVQGKSVDDAMRLIDEAVTLEEAGAFAILMECVPAEIGRLVNDALTVPTISYGAGAHCDAQGLVCADILGMFDAFLPKFSKRYADLGDAAIEAFRSYRDDVIAGRFPAPENCYSVPDGVISELEQRLAGRRSAG